MLPPKKIKELAFYLLASPIGAPGGIRTPGLPVRSRTLYPAKLQVQIFTYYTLIYFNMQAPPSYFMNNLRYGLP